MRPIVRHVFKHLCAIAKDAVFPARCCSCGRFFHCSPASESKVADGAETEDRFDAGLIQFLCIDCLAELRAPLSPICTLCGRFFDSPHGVDHVCGRCLEDPFDFDKARASGLYDRALKALIRSYKYQCRVELAAPLAGLLWRTLLRYWDLEEIDSIIPVPLHRRRLRERGFNQVELMLRFWPALSRRCAVPLKSGKVMAGLLVRHRHTHSQAGLDRRDRAANLQHAFRLTDPAMVQGRRLLLVDDVLTTGATANACARVLKRGGAASVRVLTLAHAG